MYRIVSWLFKPHTLIVLTVILLSLLYAAFFSDAATYQSDVSNVKFGMLASFSVFLVYCAIQLPDSFFVRPHPSVWRVVKGFAILYLIVLVFLLFQTPEVTRESLLKIIDPTLGIRLPEKHYAEDCRVFTPENPDSQYANIVDKIDVFVPAHFFGWFMKAIIYRDAYFAWFMSLLFETHELSLKHVLPNFAECWWDHIIFDALLCNGLGILAGQIFLQYLDAREYNWAGFSQYNKNPFSLLIGQFTPKTWTKFYWRAFDSPERFVGLCFLAVIGSTLELNTFFLKYTLWIPSDHFIVGGRLILLFFISLPASREYYEYVSNPEVKKVGSMAWLLFAIAAMELLVWVKCSPGQFSHVTEHPPIVIYTWSFIFLSILAFIIIYFGILKKHKAVTKKANTSKPKIEAVQTITKKNDTEKTTKQKDQDKKKKKTHQKEKTHQKDQDKKKQNKKKQKK